MTTWIVIYLFTGLIIGCLRQIFRKESVRSKFQEVWKEQLEKLADKKEISKWKNGERTVFSANPDSNLLARASLEAKDDVEEWSETLSAFVILMAWVFLWGLLLLEIIFWGLVFLVKKMAKA